ncbi:MAG: hypothetical protein CMI18_11380 [Opitutaceae bacterium]|nr:hypothetical protein [Opitutaceae bacterium]
MSKPVLRLWYLFFCCSPLLVPIGCGGKDEAVNSSPSQDGTADFGNPFSALGGANSKNNFAGNPFAKVDSDSKITIRLKACRATISFPRLPRTIRSTEYHRALKNLQLILPKMSLQQSGTFHNSFWVEG